MCHSRRKRRFRILGAAAIVAVILIGILWVVDFFVHPTDLRRVDIAWTGKWKGEVKWYAFVAVDENGEVSMLSWYGKKLVFFPLSPESGPQPEVKWQGVSRVGVVFICKDRKLRVFWPRKEDTRETAQIWPFRVGKVTVLVDTAVAEEPSEAFLRQIELNEKDVDLGLGEL